MSSISSLSRAVTALMSSQTALNTTAHNLTNVNTDGYVRQQVVFNDSTYLNIGKNATSALSVGMGTDIETIRQVRDIFLDQSYREEQGRMNYYSAQADAIEEIETILGETEGEAFSQILDDLWNSINELQKHPDGLETRSSFVQNAVIFVERANLIQEQLEEYQVNLNGEVKDTVERINEIGYEIDNLNNLIAIAEVNGSNANDYRDSRNILLDELSGYVDIRYWEEMDGSVLVSVENVPFVAKGYVFEMSTVQATNKSALEVPYWEHIQKEVFNPEEEVSPANDNDIGSLKGLVMARGSRPANYTDLENPTYEDEIKGSVIMTAMAQFDNLVHGVVTMVNDLLSPNTGSPAVFDEVNAPYGLDGSRGHELFSRKYIDRYDDTTGPPMEYNVENASNPNTLYSAGNLEVNADILADYDLIALSSQVGYDGDSSVVEAMLAEWENPTLILEPETTGVMAIRDYYTAFVGEVGGTGNMAKMQMNNQEVMSLQIDNQRQQVIGVSSDEELGNMMKYQHAYNAAAKVVSVVDEMIEQVVTSLGTVGR